MLPVEPDRLSRHLRVLTDEIGVRLAGTADEDRARDYIADQLAACGATVSLESFPVNCREVHRQQLSVHLGGQWRSFPTSLFSSVPGTGDQVVEAPIVFFEAPAEYARPDLSHLRGKAVIHLGCHIESREAYRRLIAAEPAFVLMVDVRYPGTTPLADGMFPAYTRDLGAVPTLNVAYHDAWQWHELGADAARIRVAGGMRPSQSANVIGDLPGTSGQVIYVGSHHDTQADSVGADDNGSGVIGVLELARVLADRPRRHTIRLISFGAEEQLSVGSAAYVRQHRAELAEAGLFMFNLDGIGSRMGWSSLIVNGHAELEKLVVDTFASHGEWARLHRDIVPYGDHFPFVVAGLPAAWLHRYNCTAGRWFHHRPDDDASRVCPVRMASLLNATADLLADLANRDTMPFPRELPAAQRAAADTYWQDLFSGW